MIVTYNYLLQITDDVSWVKCCFTDIKTADDVGISAYKNNIVDFIHHFADDQKFLRNT